MPLQIVRNDITKISCDAIVNAANPSLLGGGGVDGAIHAAAGRELLEECKKLGGCPTGKAQITKGYNLPCRYVIHTVGPVWVDGKHGEREMLASCYRESLMLAKQHQCSIVAFPLISAGAYGYPKEEALQVAVSSIGEFLVYNDMEILLVVYDKDCFRISKKLLRHVEEFIDEYYVEAHPFSRSEGLYRREVEEKCIRSAIAEEAPAQYAGENITHLEKMMSELDESFSQMVMRKIDERGMTDTECYKKANIDRKLFSKIRNHINYKPSKTTAIALAIALELSLEETKDLLMKAGFALSHSSKFDIIIEYFIQNGIYDIFEINEVLFAFDQSLLGV